RLCGWNVTGRLAPFCGEWWVALTACQPVCSQTTNPPQSARRSYPSPPSLGARLGSSPLRLAKADQLRDISTAAEISPHPNPLPSEWDLVQVPLAGARLTRPAVVRYTSLFRSTSLWLGCHRTACAFLR